MTIEACVCCNTAMIAIEPTRSPTTHACCDPDDTPHPALSVDQINQS
jgi:hypothetical protein